MRISAWPTDSETDARAAAALFCALLPLFLGAFYAAMRIGFDNPATPIIAAIALSWWLNVIPFLLFILLKRKHPRASWYRSESFLSLAVVALTALLGLLAQKVGLNPMPVIGMIGAAVTLFLFANQVRGRRVASVALFVSGALLFAVWIAGVEWANGYLNPLFVENLILRGGTEHIDTIYLAAIGNMVQLHSVASVGMDGIPPIAYHFGSPAIFAQFANLIDVPVLRFYQLGVPLIVVPFFFRGVLTLANDVRSRLSTNDTYAPSLQNSWFVWLMLAAACIGLLPPNTMHAIGVWNVGPFLSESHLTVIPFSLLLIGTLYAAWTDLDRPTNALIGARGFVFFLVFVPVVLAGTGFIKLSAMLLLAPAIAWVCLRMKLWTRKLAIACGLMCGALIVLTLTTVVGGGRNNGFSLFHFERTFIPAGALAFFPVMHLFWTWLYCALRLRDTGVRTFGDLRSALASRKLLDLEAVLVIALLGLLPGMVFNLWSDAYYFSDFQRWVAFSLLLGLPSAFETFRQATNGLRPDFHRGARISRTALFAICIPFILTPFITTMSWSARLFRDNLSTRREIQKLHGPIPDIGISGSAKQLAKSAMSGELISGVREFRRTQLEPLTDPKLIRSVLQRTPRYAVMNSFLGAANMPLAQRRNTVIAVDDNVAAFWNLIPIKSYCYWSPMTAPAVAGLPLIEGIPAGCELPLYGGAWSYRERTDGAIRQTTGDEILCQTAARKGFSRVLRVSEKHGITSSRTLVCGKSNGRS